MRTLIAKHGIPSLFLACLTVFGAASRACAQEQLCTLGRGGEVYTRIAISPDGSKVLAIEYGWIHLWDVATKSMVDLTRMEGLEKEVGGRVNYAGFCRGGKSIFLHPKGDTTVIEVSTGKVQATLKGAAEMELVDASKSDVLVTTLFDNEKDFHFVWQISSGKELVKIESPRGSIDRRWSMPPDGKLVVFVDGKALRIFDLPSGKERPSGVAPSEIMYSLEVSSDGRYLVVLDQLQATIFDIATSDKSPKQLWTMDWKSFDGTSAHRAKFSPDSRTLMISGGKTVLIDVATQKVNAKFDGHRAWPLFAGDRTLLLPKASTESRNSISVANMDGSIRSQINVTLGAISVSERGDLAAILGNGSELGVYKIKGPDLAEAKPK